MAERPTTRLLKTKMFTEQLIIRRKKDGPPGSWDPPVSQSKPLDDAVNEWIDQTGNDLVNVTTPGMFMQWMDADRTTRLIVASVMVTYVPALTPVPQIKEEPKPDVREQIPADWEPVVVG
jgi:hypothetical protein